MSRLRAEAVLPEGSLFFSFWEYQNRRQIDRRLLMA
jgi:hypothetical protein